MKIHLLLRYYLNLNIKFIGKSPHTTINSSTRSLVKEDIESRTDELITTSKNYQGDYSYRVIINELSKTLWHGQIRYKKSGDETSSKLNVIYKTKNKFFYITLIK